MKRPVMGWLQSPQRAVEREVEGGGGAGDQWLRRWVRGVEPGVGRGRLEGLVAGAEELSSGATMTGMLGVEVDGVGSSGRTMVGIGGGARLLSGSDTAIVGIDGAAEASI